LTIPEGTIARSVDTVLANQVLEIRQCADTIYVLYKIDEGTDSGVWLSSFDSDSMDLIASMPSSKNGICSTCYRENLIVSSKAEKSVSVVTPTLQSGPQSFYQLRGSDALLATNGHVILAEWSRSKGAFKVTKFSACPKDRYGPKCDKKCNCDRNRGSCFHGENGLGICVSCKQGWAGRSCNIPCTTCPPDSPCRGGIQMAYHDDQHICDCKDKTRTGPECLDCREGWYRVDWLGLLKSSCLQCPIGMTCRNNERIAPEFKAKVHSAAQDYLRHLLGLPKQDPQ
jgi:hypothetical protein